MKSHFYLLFLIVLLITSCVKQEAGEGGKSTISGKVKIHNYNSLGIYKESYFAPDEKVYIIYGEDSIPSDDVDTNPDGYYRFDYLRKGSYTIFAYSKCDTCASGTEAIYVATEVTYVDENVIAPLIELID